MKALPKVAVNQSSFEKNWLSAILLEINSHLLILSKKLISYLGLNFTHVKALPKVVNEFFEKNGYLQYF